MDRKEYIEKLAGLRTLACRLYSEGWIGQRLTEHLCTWAMMALMAKPLHEEAPHQFITRWTSAEMGLSCSVQSGIETAMTSEIEELQRRLVALNLMFRELRLEMLEQVGIQLKMGEKS